MLLCIVALVLSGCSSNDKKTGGGRYSMAQDRAPDRAVDLSHVADAVPRHEPKSRGGNKSPYEVWGKQYYVMDSSRGYHQQGTASWYGKKFHGHKTSNGETYDMYGMSAAHKSLPLPSYVRVTNLDNGRQVIVRVNDRGPFHGNRLIDLSYAAAYRLDILSKGTARVEVQAIGPASATEMAKQSPPKKTPPKQAPSTPAAVSDKAAEAALNPASGKYLQVGAYSNWGSAQSVKSQLEALFQDVPVVINKHQGTSVLYRVQIGPVDHLQTLNGLYSVLANAGYANPHLVDLP